MESTVTIYDRIGGDAAISAAIDHFYERVLSDPELARFFVAVDTARLRAHQFAFLSQALGGPRSYSGSGMAKVHARLSITRQDFDRVAKHLLDTLRDLSISEDIVADVASAVAPLAAEIVSA